jgi:hypothetical protein
MAMQDALEKAHRKPSLPRAPRFPAIVCIAALLLICLYSAFAIHRLVASNAPPTVAFALGTAADHKGGSGARRLWSAYGGV